MQLAIGTLLMMGLLHLGLGMVVSRRQSLGFEAAGKTGLRASATRNSPEAPLGTGRNGSHHHNHHRRSSNSSTTSSLEWCGMPGRAGLAPLYSSSQSSFMDWGPALKDGDGVTQVLVTAVAVKGTYADGKQLIALSSAVEETRHQLLELRFSPDRRSLDVHAPQLDFRTTDQASEQALRMATGTGRIGSIPRLLCQGGGGSQAEAGSSSRANASKDVAQEEGVHVETSHFIKQNFFVTQSETFRLKGATYKAASHRVVRQAVFPENVEVTVEYMLTGSEAKNVSTRMMPLTVAYSMIRLPKEVMEARPNDNRLAYFNTKYTDVGVHRIDEGNATAPLRRHAQSFAYSIDTPQTRIFRYNLERLPNKQISIYIDPSVPEGWWQYFREGIEAWNQAFSLIGHPRGVRAVAPNDPEWPEDFDAGDARYTVVSWVVDPTRVVSRGHARVDPRSGEVIRSEISMSAGWLRSWLSDLGELAPELTTDMQNGFHSEEGQEAPREAEGEEAPLSLLSLGSRVQEHPHTRTPLPEDPLRLSGRSHNDFSAFSAAGTGRLGLWAAAGGKPMTPAQQEAILGAGIRSIMMHETGHILGLRHNFKGSLGVSYECTQQASCSAEHGLSASVMDYLPINVPDNGDPDSVHFFTPVLGAYDKLAIAYGYINASKLQAERLEFGGQSLSSLDEIVTAAEQFQVCTDADKKGTDPECTGYDLSSDPLRYYAVQLETYRKTQHRLLDAAVAPGEVYTAYGKAVEKMMRHYNSIANQATKYIGGANLSLTHRSFEGSHSGRGAFSPEAAGVQRRALALVTRVLGLEESGLLPPESNSAYMVSGTEEVVAPLRLRPLARALAHSVLDGLIAPSRLLAMLEDQRRGGLDCDELLSELVGRVALPINATVPSNWDLQLQLVQRLTTLASSETVPATLSSLARQQLNLVDQATQAALERLQTWGRFAWCANEGASCLCSGHVRYGLAGQWSELRRVDGHIKCAKGVWGDPKPWARRTCECLSAQHGEQELYLAHLQHLQRVLLNTSVPSLASQLHKA